MMGQQKNENKEKQKQKNGFCVQWNGLMQIFSYLIIEGKNLTQSAFGQQFFFLFLFHFRYLFLFWSMRVPLPLAVWRHYTNKRSFRNSWASNWNSNSNSKRIQSNSRQNVSILLLLCKFTIPYTVNQWQNAKRNEIKEKLH